MNGLREVELSPVLPATNAPNAFATLADVKAALGIADGSQDAPLQRLLDLSPVILEAYACALLQARDVIETNFQSEPVANYLTAHPWLATGVTLTIDGVTVPPDELFTSRLYGAVRRVDGGQITGNKIVAAYQTATVNSAALSHATIELVREMFSASKRDGAVKREQLEGVGAVEYASDGSNLMRGPSGVAVPLSVGVALAPFVRRLSI